MVDPAVAGDVALDRGSRRRGLGSHLPTLGTVIPRRLRFGDKDPGSPFTRALLDVSEMVTMRFPRNVSLASMKLPMGARSADSALGNDLTSTWQARLRATPSPPICGCHEK
jgi:hypothetical protein